MFSWVQSELETETLSGSADETLASERRKQTHCNQKMAIRIREESSSTTFAFVHYDIIKS